jgi:hypothetical protein
LLTADDWHLRLLWFRFFGYAPIASRPEPCEHLLADTCPLHLEYHVLIGDAGAEILNVEPAYGVGGMPLNSRK